MGDRIIAETLASAPRMRILNLITTTPIGASQISKEVGLTPMTVRFHLQRLLRLGLVEEVEERGSVGRPKLLYRATGKRMEVAFPARDYMHLSDILIKTLVSFSDQPEVQGQLRKAARNLGSDLGRSLIEKAGEGNWDTVKFRKHFVEETLKQFGAQPEIVRHTRKSIQYRMNNCPYKEIAIEYPQMICEDLDTNVHRALCKELNPKIGWKKLKCMGHGDPYCEYLASWD